jgi:hypothetical protein
MSVTAKLMNYVVRRRNWRRLENSKLQGIYVRSRARWVEEGEKPSRYFCALESRNYSNKITP